MRTKTKTRIAVTARLDVTGRLFNWKDLDGTTVSEPLFYQLTFWVPNGTTVEEYLRMLRDQWSHIPEFPYAKLQEGPSELYEDAYFRFVS